MTEDQKKNEPNQAALDAFNLARIRGAMVKAEEVNEQNNSAKNSLRGVYAQTQSQGLNNDAARIALRLAKEGDTAIDKFLTDFEKIGVYLGYLGKVFSKRQYELFGLGSLGPVPEDERATIEGRAAGFADDSEEGSTESANPYPGSIKGQAWLAAFRQARSERDAIMSMTPPPVDAKGGDGEKETEGAEGDEGKA